MAKRKKRKSKHKVLLDENRHRYLDILEAQGGTCALCPRKPALRRKLDLDHDHKRLVIRGLLCHRCNRALPSWMTSDWLKRASTYVEGEA